MNENPAEQIEPAQAQGRSRTPIIVGVSIAVAAVLGVGAYAGITLAGGGAQPAEALPASAIAYASVDIDPGAKQKIEAIRTLRKFPDLRKEIGVNEKDDLRKKIFTEAVKGTDCETKVDFDDDIEPWLGDRAAVAAVDLGGKEPSPAIALQIGDEGAAKKGVEALRECGGGADEDFSYAFNGDYLVISDGQDNAATIVKDAKKASLADDKSYREWTGKAGGDGIVNFYVSPKAGEILVGMIPDGVPNSDSIQTAMDKFKGVAGAVRFADAGVEIEVATNGQEDLSGSTVGDSIADLPKDTAVAFGFGVPEKYGESLVKQLGDTLGADADSMIAQAEAQTGLDLPEDLDTLLGKSVLVALGGDAPKSLEDTQGPSDIPAGLKIRGDADKISDVVAKIEERAGLKLADAGLVRSSDSGSFILATNDDYADQLKKKKGSLGDNENFKDVVPEADKSSFAFFVDFDSAWREAVINTVQATGAPSAAVTAAKDNTKPLGALGISAWADGDTAHVLLKLTTD